MKLFSSTCFVPEVGFVVNEGEEYILSRGILKNCVKRNGNHRLLK